MDNQTVEALKKVMSNFRGFEGHDGWRSISPAKFDQKTGQAEATRRADVSGVGLAVEIRENRWSFRPVVLDHNRVELPFRSSTGDGNPLESLALHVAAWDVEAHHVHPVARSVAEAYASRYKVIDAYARMRDAIDEGVVDFLVVDYLITYREPGGQHRGIGLHKYVC